MSTTEQRKLTSYDLPPKLDPAYERAAEIIAKAVGPFLAHKDSKDIAAGAVRALVASGFDIALRGDEPTHWMPRPAQPEPSIRKGDCK